MTVTPRPIAATQLKNLREKAKQGDLHASDIAKLLNSQLPHGDRISQLRFALRLKRWTDQQGGNLPLQSDIETEIAKIYKAQYEHALDPVSKLKFARWASRYGMEDFDWSALESDFHAHFNATLDMRTRLNILCSAEYEVQPDCVSGIVRATAANLKDIEIVTTPVRRIDTRMVLSREPVAGMNLEFGKWSFSFHTDEGPKPPNQDAILFASFSDGSYLVAIADGTGDSHDGARSAEILLKILPEFVALTGRFDVAIEMAAASVRADNVKRGEENSCTLVALLGNGDHACLAHLSDPIHWIQLDSAAPFWSFPSKVGRVNIGGEPYGYILTSSGNKVGCFSSFAESPDESVRELSGLRSFVLGCDGLLANSIDLLGNGESVIFVDFAGNMNRPGEVVKQCCTNARDAMQRKVRPRSPDNISCVAGYRNS